MAKKSTKPTKEETLETILFNCRNSLRGRAAMAINVAEVYTKYEIGHHIIENEQQGKERAVYGKGVLKELSARLTERFGSGWSVDTLEKCRKFYSVYSISATPQRKSSTLQTKSGLPSDEMPTLSVTRVNIME